VHYLLFYEVGEDYLARRAQYRDAHLEKAWNASKRGELVLAGALANPVNGAVLLFEGDSPEVAEKFARADPYVTSGTVKRWYVREWTTVAGDKAATAVTPKTSSASAEVSSWSAHEASEESSTQHSAILRMWKARATPQKAHEYVEHATKKVFPSLRTIKGHRGAYLLRREFQGMIEFVVLTLWESLDAVRRFSGMDPERAVIEREARAILMSCDDSVTHFEIVHCSEP
jgi:uncharacterized protein YciI/heme-degrading monooxygenase HmoA